MDTLKECPRVLLHKLLLTVMIGAGCLAVGTTYFCFSHDTVFLVLSSIVFAVSIARGFALFRLIAKMNYSTIEGVCVGVAAKPLRRYRKIRLMGEDGIETSLLLDKQTKVKIGYRYRAYFKEEMRPSLGSEYLDTALSGDCFLGIEELGEYVFGNKATK